MNFIQYAIKHIKNSIPREILEVALYPARPNWRVTPNLDKLIEMQLLRPKLFVDMSLIRGVVVTIPLNECNILYRDQYGVHIQIPSRLLNNRAIVSVESIYSITTYLNTQNDNSSPLSEAQTSMDSISPEFTGHMIESVDIITDNEIFIPYIIDTFDMMVKLTVEYSNNFNEINPRAIVKLRKPILYSAQSIIYNKLVIKADSAAIYHGYTNEKIKDIISRYEDAEEKYQEFIEEGHMARILFTNDSKAMRDYVRLIVPSRL